MFLYGLKYCIVALLQRGCTCKYGDMAELLLDEIFGRSLCCTIRYPNLIVDLTLELDASTVE